MIIKKTKEGGFINEQYEKVNRITAILSWIFIAITFVVLLVNCIEPVAE